MILQPSEQTIDAAVQALQGGELIGLPTETVYGLAADAQQDAAVAKIYACKGRPTNHPLIVHVADAQGVAHFARAVPDFAQTLIDAFWPGPLTLILSRRPGVAEAAAAGLATIGLRCPSHAVAQQLLHRARAATPSLHGVAAPSANRFGRISPTRASHVADELGGTLLVLDGGSCQVGLESTIVDCSRGRPVVLRPGAITAEQVAQATGFAVGRVGEDEAALADSPQAPGTLSAHYAPRATLRLMNAQAIQAALGMLGGQGRDIAIYTRTPVTTPSSAITSRTMPSDPQAAAHALFAALRAMDSQGVKLIWVEQPPDDPAWDAVRDRLERAAASS